LCHAWSAPCTRPIPLQPGAVLAAVKHAARRAKPRGGLRPCLTAAARDALGWSGRDEETACFSRTKKRQQVGSAGAPSKRGSFLPMPNGEEANTKIQQGLQVR
jgi:hypothetical protein